MKMTDLGIGSDTQVVTEMAKAKICPQCGNQMTGYHYWYKGGWKCKASSTANPGASAQPTAAANTPAAVAPAPAAKAAPQAPAAKAAPAQLSLEEYTQTVQKWVKQHTIEGPTVTIDPEHGTVDIAGAVMFNPDFTSRKDAETGLRMLPIRIGKVDGDFMIASGELGTFENGPQDVNGDFVFAGNPIQTGCVGLPARVNGSVDLSGSVTNLQGIHKILRQMNGEFTCIQESKPLESHALGLLMIRGLTKVNLRPTQLEEILNKHLQAEERDVNACQEDLVEAGLTAFAKL